MKLFSLASLPILAALILFSFLPTDLQAGGYGGGQSFRPLVAPEYASNTCQSQGQGLGIQGATGGGCQQECAPAQYVPQQQVIQQQVYQPPQVQQQIIQREVAQPVYQQPLVQREVVQQPVYQQRLVQREIVQQPVYQQPAAIARVRVQPIIQREIVQQPVYQQQIRVAAVRTRPVYAAPAVATVTGGYGCAGGTASIQAQATTGGHQGFLGRLLGGRRQNGSTATVIVGQ